MPTSYARNEGAIVNKARYVCTPWTIINRCGHYGVRYNSDAQKTLSKGIAVGNRDAGYCYYHRHGRYYVEMNKYGEKPLPRSIFTAVKNYRVRWWKEKVAQRMRIESGAHGLGPRIQVLKQELKGELGYDKYRASAEFGLRFPLEMHAVARLIRNSW